MQVLSYTNTVPKDLPASKAVYFNAMANDELAAYVEAGPSRFAAFATLPMQDPHAAAAELERCVTQLGFKGALLDAWFNGHGYEEERFLPVFEKAAELDVPISLHPSFVDCAEPWRGRHGAQLPIWGARTCPLHALREPCSPLGHQSPSRTDLLGRLGISALASVSIRQNAA